MATSATFEAHVSTHQQDDNGTGTTRHPGRGGPVRDFTGHRISPCEIRVGKVDCETSANKSGRDSCRCVKMNVLVKHSAATITSVLVGSEWTCALEYVWDDPTIPPVEQ